MRRIEAPTFAKAGGHSYSPSLPSPRRFSTLQLVIDL
jgi:hypothetical protein